MKAYFGLFLIAFWSCQNNPKKGESAIPQYEVPTTKVAHDQLVLNSMEGIWSLGGDPYSGYSLQYYPNGNIRTKTGFYKGKKQGLSSEYYPDGHPKHQTPYHQNLMHGEVKNWFGTGGHPQLAVRNFYLGKPHGVHKKWYKNGQLFKVMNYQMGKEKGMQQAFNENGSIYANYEAKNGRVFGLKRSMLCYELEDEKTIRYETK